MFEYLVTREWNCLEGLGGLWGVALLEDVSLGVGFEVSKAQSLSCWHAPCRDDNGPNL